MFWSSWGISTLCLFWTLVQGSLRLIGSDGPIRAAPGDDVVLPCRVEPEWDAARRTVEWSRPDLRAAGPRRRGAYVLVRRFQRTERDMMMETYVQRTSLSEAALRRGDVSLSIRNVSLGDSGTFRCFIPTLGKDAEVRLVIDPNYVKVTPTERIPDRTPTSPTPQEETSRNARRSRALLWLPVLVFFFVCLTPVSLFISRKCPQNRKVPRVAAVGLSRSSPDLRVDTG